MNSGCTKRRDELALALCESEAFVPALREHLEVCAECRAYAEGVTRCVDTLGNLERMTAPADLAGRVVAALNAGFREDRTARYLEALSRQTAPQELEQQLSGSERLAQDLEARVARELAHPEEIIGERLARVAQRYEAPAELEALVAQDLATGRRRSKRHPVKLVSGLALAAAASLVLWINSGPVAPAKPSLDSLSFRVREVESVTELNSMARLLMGGVTGGASEAREF